MANVNKVVYGGKTLIDLSSDTVNENVLLYGYTAHNKAGEFIVGSATTGGSGFEDEIIMRTLAEYNNDRISLIGSYAFAYCESLTGVYCSSVTDICDNAFMNASYLQTVSFTSVINIGADAFSYCYSLEDINLPIVKNIGYDAFENCSALQKIDLPVVEHIDSYAFYGCSSLDTVIIRNVDNVCELSNIDAFEGTIIANSEDEGYIYVPSSLVEQYKVASEWESLAHKFRAIEDYPEITE